MVALVARGGPGNLINPGAFAISGIYGPGVGIAVLVLFSLHGEERKEMNNFPKELGEYRGLTLSEPARIARRKRIFRVGMEITEINHDPNPDGELKFRIS